MQLVQRQETAIYKSNYCVTNLKLPSQNTLPSFKIILRLFKVLLKILNITQLLQ